MNGALRFALGKLQQTMLKEQKAGQKNKNILLQESLYGKNII